MNQPNQTNNSVNNSVNNVEKKFESKQIPSLPKTRLLIIIMAIILAVIVVGLVVYFVIVKINSNKKVEPENGAQEIQEMQDWLTYQNEEYGFEFQYPDKLFFDRENLSLWKSEEYKKYLEAKPKLRLVQSELNGKTSEKFIQSTLGLDSFGSLNEGLETAQMSYENIVMGNNKIFKVHEPGHAEGIYHHFFSHADIIVDIQSYSESDLDKEFNQILSTFKFLSNTSDWLTYTNEEYGFEFKYPEGLDKYSEWGYVDKIVQVSTIEETRKKYDELKACPGDCGRLIGDDGRLEEQFEILLKSTECLYSENYKNEVKERFILLPTSPGGINLVDSINNENLQTCGLKLIGSTGYTAWIGNYYYRAAFLVDNKIITMDISLLSLGAFEEVDKFWEELGLHDGECDKTCDEKQLKYFRDENFINQELIKDVIKKYDELVKSFKFLD